jgi:hypothetical protein
MLKRNRQLKISDLLFIILILLVPLVADTKEYKYRKRYSKGAGINGVTSASNND